MSYSSQRGPALSGNTWKCSQCGSQMSGTPLPKRSAIHMHHSSEGEQMHAKCRSCGFTLCSSCLSLQKPSEQMPDRDALCPECGRTFGDGPVLVPEAYAASSAVVESPGPPVSGKSRDHVKDLRSWSGWLIFWSVINTGGLLFDSTEYEEVTADEQMGINCVTGCFVFIGVVILIAAIVALTQKRPWPGFYIVFGIYLIFIGLINLTSGGFWLVLGLVQLGISISLFVNWYKYRQIHYGSTPY